jgi:type IV secretory pathway protease TraF
MANFESGVSSYIVGECTITVYFPVDEKGRAEICCKHCPYLSSNERMCQLNKEPVAFPSRYVGNRCPLQEINYNTKGENNNETH